MASIGALVVSLEANIAKFTSDMNAAATVTQKTMSGITSAIEGAKSQFLSLAASVVSVGAAVKAVQGAVELGDQLKTLSDATGIAVEKLDQLAIIAKLNGAEVENFAKSFRFLGKAVIESQDPASKTGQLFAELGIKVKDANGNIKGTDQILGEVAESLNTIENETTRAAVGTAIFGKSYLQIAASLRNYKEDQERANEVLANFGSVSERAASLADDLGDTFTLLGEGSKRSLLGALVPGMAAVREGIKVLLDSGGQLQSGFGDVVSKVAEVATQAFIGVRTVFLQVGTAIGGIFAAIATQSTEPIKAAIAEIKRLNGEAEGEMARIRTAAKFSGLDDSDQVSRAAAERVERQAANANKLNQILAKNKDAVDAFAKAMAALAKDEIAAQAALDKTSGAIEEQAPALIKLKQIQEDPVWATFTQRQKDEYEARAKSIAVIQQQEMAMRKNIEAMKEAVKIDEQIAETQKKAAEARQKVLLTFAEGNEKLRRENELIGEDAEAHAHLAAQMEFEAASRAILDNAANSTAETIRTELDLLHEQLEIRQRLISEGFAKTKFVENFKNAIETVTNGLTNFFTDLFENGTSAFKNLWENFKRFALQAFAEIAAKQVVVSLVGALGIGGATGAQAAAQTAASGAGGLLQFLTGSGGGGGGGLSGLGQILGLGTAGPNFLQGLGNLSFGFSDFTQLLGQGVGIFQAASTAFSGLGSSIGAVLGPVGLLVGGIGLLSNLLSKGGGPMERLFGTSGAGIETFGDLSATHKLVGTDAVASAILTQAAQQEKATYDGVLKALGTSGLAEFALYTSRDIKGTASNQLDVRATVGGREVYAANIEDQLGRDPEALKARLQLEASRAVLAALQASDLPKYLGDLFSSLDVGTATQEQIDNITKVAIAIKNAVDLIPEISDALTSLDASSIQGLVDAVGGVDQFSQSLQFLTANFSTAAEKADETEKALTQSFEALGLSVPKTHAAFLDLLKSFDLTTASGRSLYAAVLNLSGAFVAVKGTADQAAEALQASISSLHEAQATFTGQQQVGESNAEKLNTLISQFIADKPWAQEFVSGGGNLAEALSGVLDEDFAQYSESNQALIVQIISLAASIKNAATSISDASKATVDATSAAVAQYQALEARANKEAEVQEKLTASGTQLGIEASQQYATLAGQSTGDFGAKAALQISFINAEIAELQKTLDRQRPGTVPLYKVIAEVKSLQDQNVQLTQSLQLYTTLKAQYGAAIAEQLVNLTKQYKDQAAALGGNVAQLTLLNGIFEEQWNSIINGTAQGVDGVQNELQKLQQNILDYVDSLKISDLSPLKPVEKLAQARTQYESDLAKARAGDQKALQDITASADAYLKLQREFSASSPDYTNVFNQIVGQLTELGTSTTLTLAPPMNPADQALLNALPVGSKLMSAADMAAVVAYFAGTGSVAAANTLQYGTPTPTTPEASNLKPVFGGGSFLPKTPTDVNVVSDKMSEEMKASFAESLYQSTAAIVESNQTQADRVINAIDGSAVKTVEAITVGLK